MYTWQCSRCPVFVEYPTTDMPAGWAMRGTGATGSEVFCPACQTNTVIEGARSRLSSVTGYLRRITLNVFESGSDLSNAAATAVKFDRARYLMSARAQLDIVKTVALKAITEIDKILQYGANSGAHQIPARQSTPAPAPTTQTGVPAAVASSETIALQPPKRRQ
jgi:hypothetical protein